MLPQDLSQLSRERHDPLLVALPTDDEGHLIEIDSFPLSRESLIDSQSGVEQEEDERLRSRLNSALRFESNELLDVLCREECGFPERSLEELELETRGEMPLRRANP